MLGDSLLADLRLLVNRKTREQQFERITEEHGAGISRVISSYARTPAEHEDLTQEVGLAMWRAFATFRGECSERTFAFRIAHNQGLTWACRRKRHANLDEVEEPPDYRPTPEAALDQHERRERLLNAIRALPLGHRQVLTLALEELSHDEIADVLGITTNNVAVRLNRAKDALRKILGGSS